jgi:hypothetical protein
VQSTRQGQDIVTLDESWIYLFSEHDPIWTAPGEIVIDRKRHTVQSAKFMPTVVWNPIRFHVLKALPKGRKFNAQYYTNDILVAFSDWRRQTGQTGGTRPNKLWVHSDNARPHTAKMSRDYIGLNRMEQALHPPIRHIWHPRTFSFLATSRKSDGYRAETPSEFLVRILVILAEIPRETLNAVLLEWMERLHKCMQVDDGYVG